MSANVSSHPFLKRTYTLRSLGITDVVIVSVLLALGVFQVATVQRVESYGSDSSMYILLAHNILRTGHYEFNFKPHTVYPPGFPLLLTAVSMLTGREGYDIFIFFMPIFSTLALITSYFVLRWDQGPFV